MSADLRPLHAALAAYRHPRRRLLDRRSAGIVLVLMLAGARRRPVAGSAVSFLARVIREPLVHFLLIGAAVFALYARDSGEPPGAARPHRRHRRTHPATGRNLRQDLAASAHRAGAARPDRRLCQGRGLLPRGAQARPRSRRHSDPPSHAAEDGIPHRAGRGRARGERCGPPGLSRRQPFRISYRAAAGVPANLHQPGEVRRTGRLAGREGLG